MDYYSNLKVYNKKGQRMAIFGEFIESGEHSFINIFQLTCSKKDQFCKATAKKVFEEYQSRRGQFLVDGKCNGCVYHPDVFPITPEDVNRPKWSFLKYVNNNFYKETIVEVEYNKELVEMLSARFQFDKKTNVVTIKTIGKWLSKV